MKRLSKEERLAIYFDRLRQAVAPSTFEEALQLLSSALDEVEDEFSGEPNEPRRWAELDRMFPPQADRISKLVDRPGVWSAKAKGHYVLIGQNGSMEFWRFSGARHSSDGILDFAKLGGDGKGLSS